MRIKIQIRRIRWIRQIRRVRQVRCIRRIRVRIRRIRVLKIAYKKPFLSNLFQIYLWPQTFGSSRPEVFCRKGVLRNFAKLTGKHLSQSLLFTKAASLRPATLLEKRLWRRCFPVNFVKFLRTLFFTEHLRWLLLNFMERIPNLYPDIWSKALSGRS